MLDEKTEESIISLIKNEFRNCLMIFITHRLRSISSVDLILVLNRGKISGVGTFKELIKNKESFFGNMFMSGVDLDGNYN